MMSAATTSIATTLSAVAAMPSESSEDGRGREHGDDREGGLPTDAEQPGDRRWQAIAPHPVRGAREHHRGGRSPFAGGRDNAAQSQKLTMMPIAPTMMAWRNEMSKGQDAGAVAQSEDRDVGAEPGPKELTGLALALVLGDDVDAVLFNAKCTGSAGA